MRTGKSISNIAYHRPEVFATLTNLLRKSGKIGPCLWVAHRGEGGDKPHIHMVLLGGFQTYNTEGLATLWGVDVIDGQAASVSALWRVTKSIEDWLLYAIHHPKYLTYKGLDREAHYDWADVHVTAGDEGVLEQLTADAKDALEQLGDRTTSRLIRLAKMGYTWQQVVLSGLVPMGQLSQAAKAWPIIKRNHGHWEGDDDESDSLRC